MFHINSSSASEKKYRFTRGNCGVVYQIDKESTLNIPIVKSQKDMCIYFDSKGVRHELDEVSIQSALSDTKYRTTARHASDQTRKMGFFSSLSFTQPLSYF